MAERYNLVRKLGEGGQGEVWLAHDSWAENSKVALKYVARQQFRMLAAEFASLRRLSHPHLVSALDLFDDSLEDRGILVEEFVEGQAIHHWAKGRGIEQVALALSQICHALAHLHIRDLIHMDPSANNI